LKLQKEKEKILFNFHSTVWVIKPRITR